MSFFASIIIAAPIALVAVSLFTKLIGRAYDTWPDVLVDAPWLVWTKRAVLIVGWLLSIDVAVWLAVIVFVWLRAL